MHLFFAAGHAASHAAPPGASLERVQDDPVTLSVCLDDAQTHSGDVFRASFELVGPEKYAGNVRLDYIVVYLYGLCVLNQELLTACTSGPLAQKQEHLNLPFYGASQKEEQKFLLFYTNPIVLCTDLNFSSPRERTHYQLSCILPPFLPPSYNGRALKFKYCMYVQAVKRLYRNRTQFVTQLYERHLPLQLLCCRCVCPPVLDLALLPIKPSSGADPPECLCHDFRVEVRDGEKKHQGEAAQGGTSHWGASHGGILHMVPSNSPHFPPHLYKRGGKTPLDALLCLYLTSSLRKEDSSLFLLNHVLPNYSYFHHMHLFMYVAHHWGYYTGELSLSGDAHRIGSLDAFFSLLRSTGGTPTDGTSKGRGVLTEGETNPMENLPPQKDDEVHHSYLSNYPHFSFNQMTYIPIRWFNNLVVCHPSDLPSEATDEEDLASLHMGETSSQSSSELEEATHIGGQSRPNRATSFDETTHQGETANATLPPHRQGLLLDRAYTAVDTIIKCMHEGDMFKQINLRKVKPQRMSPHLGSNPSDRVTLPHEEDNPDGEEPSKEASQKIFRINSGGKNICVITLMDGMNNQVTATFPCDGIINVRLFFGDATICTVHVDVRLKRVERVKINPSLLTMQRSKLQDENEFLEGGNTSVDSEGTSHHCISSCKMISERNVSTLHCSVKNVSFVLGEEVVPAFANDTLRVGYLLDFDFFCRRGEAKGGEGGEANDADQTNEAGNANHASEKKESTNQANAAEVRGGTHPGSLSINESLDDDLYSLTFRIPIHITGRAHDVCPHDASSSANPPWHAKANTNESRITSQLLLQNSHKFVYADRRHFLRTLKM
ncbi:conserved Plasmodium protein, unknown function [Plasmodium vivax]|nr:conserved Plasmodium protein, unknown function [Plasmodium vivax]